MDEREDSAGSQQRPRHGGGLSSLRTVRRTSAAAKTMPLLSAVESPPAVPSMRRAKGSNGISGRCRSDGSSIVKGNWSDLEDEKLTAMVHHFLDSKCDPKGIASNTMVRNRQGTAGPRGKAVPRTVGWGFPAFLHQHPSIKQLIDQCDCCYGLVYYKSKNEFKFFRLSQMAQSSPAGHQ